jgi:hypothetical protein
LLLRKYFVRKVWLQNNSGLEVKYV